MKAIKQCIIEGCQNEAKLIAKSRKISYYACKKHIPETEQIIAAENRIYEISNLHKTKKPEMDESLMSKKDILHEQFNLFGVSTIVPEPKKKNILTDKERELRKEKSEAHTAWKLLKSRKFTDFSERHKFLLRKYYGIQL